MTRAVWFIGSVCIVGLALATVPILLFQKMQLVAEERLDLLASPDQAARTVGHLQQGSRVWVVGCHDIHHYVVVKVRLDGGRVGYVHEGKFRLVRPPASSAWSAPISWGCS
jgi:hypothetical protein